MRKALIVVFVLACALSVAAAGGVFNRGRDLPISTTTLAVINTCQPESDATALGWDQTPVAGGWGGKPITQFAVAWEPGVADVATLAGRLAQCTIAGVSGKTPKEVRLESLDGQANDDFCVFASIGAGDLLIGCFDETNVAGEVWTVKTFTLPANAFAPGQDVTVKILTTGNAWGSFGTWGQLGVSYIEVWGE